MNNYIMNKLFTRSLPVFVGLLIGNLYFGIYVHAQDKTQKTVSTVMSFSDWLVECKQIDGVAQPCTMGQNILRKNSSTIFIEANFAKRGDSTQMTLVLPLGVYLPAGVGLEVVGWDKRQYDYDFCNNLGCYVNEIVDEKMLELLRKKEQATIFIYSTAEEKVTVPLSITGFLDAFKKL